MGWDRIILNGSGTGNIGDFWWGHDGDILDIRYTVITSTNPMP